jgi:predicted nucleic acid-binding protein
VAISSCLVDTNILLRLTRRADPHHQIISSALAQLIAQGAILYYTHQNDHRSTTGLALPLTRQIAKRGQLKQE